ncbi:MAG: hypothetical protein U1C73_20610 [Dietzia sp.]|nr:hypothetical protein [Dietzia sp.]
MNDFYTSDTTIPLVNDRCDAQQDEVDQREDTLRSDMLAHLRERFLFGV